MAEYTPKAFAVGEILTAQDVNEYLVNQARRIKLRGAEVADGLDGSTIQHAEAIIDIDGDGDKLVHVFVRVSGHSGLSQGDQNTQIATLNPDLAPNQYMGATVSAASRGATAGISTTGTIAIRWSSSSAGTGVNLAITASYPILEQP